MMVALTPALKASVRDVPALAWTVAHAYTTLPSISRRDAVGAVLRLAAAAWLVPMWLVVWVPVVASSVAAATGARCDRHALVTVRPAGRRALRGRSAVVMAAVGAVSGSLLIGPAVLFLPWWAVTLLLLPLVPDLAGVALRGRRRGRGTAPRAHARARAGETVWIVELYAAHPAGRGHGGRLVDELVAQVPAGVWLMTAAASARLAEHYRSRYGFRSWDPGRPLLLERTPTCLPPLGPVIPVPVPQQQPGQ